VVEVRTIDFGISPGSAWIFRVSASLVTYALKWSGMENRYRDVGNQWQKLRALGIVAAANTPESDICSVW
jgi:hypothetical protein